eukprot:5450257-Alexandrium_andersonii.AAC.1
MCIRDRPTTTGTEATEPSTSLITALEHLCMRQRVSPRTPPGRPVHVVQREAACARVRRAEGDERARSASPARQRVARARSAVEAAC